MIIKNKESFLQGMIYAAGIAPAQGVDWWEDMEKETGLPVVGDQKFKKEFLDCLEQMMLGYAGLIEEECDLDALNLEFKE